MDFKEKVDFWKSSPYICDSPTCPIKHIHNDGRYLHDNQFVGHDDVFGTSNPPPLIWAAYLRVVNEAVEGSSTDVDIVRAFIENHTLIVYDSNGEQEMV